MFEFFNKTTEMGEMNKQACTWCKKNNYYSNVGRKKKSEKFQYQG